MTQELKPEEYTFEFRDEFDRRPFAEKLIKLILSEHDFFPLAITGQWGTGKTEFCKKTVHLISEQHNNTITAEYLNAFSEDPYDDPLLSITSTICKTFIKDESRKGEYLKKFAKLLVPHLGASALKALFPLLTPVVDSAKDAIVQFNTENIQQNLENRSQIESSIKELKELIKEVSNNKPFVLFIDELDRCRPNFALHTLETVKHIFDTENLKIIFVINKEQLIEIIKHSYGNNEYNAEKYLDKFFQIQLKLPEFSKSRNQQIQNSAKYLDDQFKRKGVFNLPLFNEDSNPNKQGKNSDAARLLIELSTIYNLSLRDIEKLTKHILIYSTLYNRGHKLPIFALIDAYAIFHFTFNKKAFQNFKNNLPILEDNNDLFIPDSEVSSPIPARLLLHHYLYDPDDTTSYPYTGTSDVAFRNRYLKEALFALDNLLLQ